MDSVDLLTRLDGVLINYDSDKEVNLNNIIKIMSPYSKNELVFLRDCIDFMIIYNNHLH